MMTTDTLPTLPALKSLGNLADIRPTVVIDTREQDALPISRLPTIRAGLVTGDYSALGMEHLFSIERKSIADLVGCCTGESRERFERELVRLRGYRFKRLLIVGDRGQVERGEYHAKVSPRSVFATLSAFEIRYDCPVVWAATPGDAARLVESWAWWAAREIVESANSLLRGNPTDS